MKQATDSHAIQGEVSTSDADRGATTIPESRLRWLPRSIAGMVLLVPLAIAMVWSNSNSASPQTNHDSAGLADSEDAWRKRLTPEQFHILRESGTERPFSNQYHNHKAEGTYACAGCGNLLFASATKFDSGTGWPSFYAPLKATAVRETLESDLFSQRIEVACRQCGGHLGHVFDDGPNPTGLRYCMNSAALNFLDTRSSEKDKADGHK